jgi:aromatic-L-amino-acid decarboxylase
VYEKINSQGEFYISSSVVCGIYIIRIVSANTAAEEKYLQMVFERLVEAAEEERGGKA